MSETQQPLDVAPAAAPVAEPAAAPAAASTGPGFLGTRIYSDKYPLLLRIPEESDAGIVNEITSDSNIYEANTWLARRASISESDALTKLIKMRKYAEYFPPPRVEFVVVLLSAVGSQEEGKVIGLTGVRDFQERPGGHIAEVFSSILTTYNNKPEYFIECLKLSIDFALTADFGIKVSKIALFIPEKHTDALELLKDYFGWKRGAVDGQGRLRRYEADRPAWETAKHALGKKGKGGGLGGKLKGLFK
jgi:hypothetical protein